MDLHFLFFTKFCFFNFFLDKKQTIYFMMNLKEMKINDYITEIFKG